MLNAESVKPDGFRILVLDYINPKQSDCAALMSRQRAALEVDGGGRWLNFMTDIHLKSFGYTGCES